jgi:hypothetical protein
MSAYIHTSQILSVQKKLEPDTDHINELLGKYSRNGSCEDTGGYFSHCLVSPFDTTILYELDNFHSSDSVGSSKTKSITLHFAYVTDARVFEVAKFTRGHYRPFDREYPNSDETLTVEDFYMFIDRVLTDIDKNVKRCYF